MSFVSSAVLFFVALLGSAAPLQSYSQQAGLDVAATAVMLPSQTKVELSLTIPVWAGTAKPGDPIYARTNFPVTVGNSIAIPAGTWVEGVIVAVIKPTRKLSRAELQILFTKIIFANGYTIVLPDIRTTTFATSGRNAAPSAATAANVTVQVSTANDLLLDNGAQIEMTLAAPLALDARQIANAVQLSHAQQPGNFKSATLCRPTADIPGSPGTSDTVIPGSPGTPSITIPGGPGMPDTTIPGTPGTPPTVIPGTPGTPDIPGTVCPAAPIVISSVPVAMKPVQIQGSAPVTSK
jgi:hypothetical protein